MSIELCEEQRDAVARIRNFSETAIILTGSAGSGKSTVVRALLEEYPDEFEVCATTGKAAVQVGGVTVDKLFNLDRGRWRIRSLQAQRKSMRQCSERIIIDEASMIGAKMANLLYTAARLHDKKLILVGDWAQAAPVKDEWPFKTALFKDIEVINLKQNHRQDEGNFHTALEYLRQGICDNNILNYFKPRVCRDEPDDERCVYIAPLNAEVTAVNNRELNKYIAENKLHGKKFTLTSRVEDKRKSSSYKLTEEKKEALIKDCSTADGVDIVPGCRVLFTRNDKDGRYMNGDSGTLKDIVFYPKRDRFGKYEMDEQGMLKFRRLSGMSEEEIEDIREEEAVVKALDIHVDRTGALVYMCKEEIPVYKPFTKRDEVEYLVIGFTLTLGYAVTVHKSQGMTIPKIYVNLSGILNFPAHKRHGIAYVALSRTRTVEDLFLEDIIPDVVQCDNEAKVFIHHLQEGDQVND